MAGNDLLGFSTTQKRNLIRYVDEQTSGAALPAATAATAGVVKQAAAVAAAPVPFADLTAAANKFNELRTSLRAAGILA